MPFADAYDRLSSAFPGLRVELRPPLDGGGWTPAAALVNDPAALDALIARDAADSESLYRAPVRPDVAATFALHRYAWPASLLMSMPWFLDRRVPRLPVEHVSFQRDEGRMTAHVTEFHCLPGDPAADLPGALVEPDEEALRGALRAAVAEHLGPLLGAFQPRMRRGPRALWGMATDELVESLWYVAQLLGEQERAAAELAALLPGRTPPFHGGAGFTPAPASRGGTAGLTRTRISCCMLYTLRPQDTCGNCPRVGEPARARRVAAG